MVPSMTPIPSVEEITAEDLKRCRETLEALVKDRRLLSGLSREERIALVSAAGRVSRPDRLEQMRLAKRVRKDRRKALRDEDRHTRAQSEIRQAREEAVFEAPERRGRVEYRTLNEPRNCYVCKGSFNKLHDFYDSMCPDCAEFNYAKRFETADLKGRVCLVTGSRVKIGYQAALKLLRGGSRVIATTRFPHDAAERYSKEKDYAEWKDRLQIHGLDLRHSPSVEVFARHLNSTLDRLDFICHNAAQTVRRPPGWYAHLLEKEALPYSGLNPEQRALLADREALKGALGGTPALPTPDDIRAQPFSFRAVPQGDREARRGRAQRALTVGHEGEVGVGLRASAHLSQIPISIDDAQLGREVFPEGKLDADLQQVDLRRTNTWRLGLAEVATAEMIEVHLINAFAPFILNARLRGLMDRDATGDKHIVNVSAMEGIFSRGTKTDKHPHTNMAKAALNMMTLTSAPDYLKSGIHMNAVDTGWVTDEDPAHHSARKQAVHDFQPPLDIVDGAARICDPFIHGLRTGEHVWGKFLKDYKPSTW
jgi:NAD(P)-dependent dehydrogenase (short-subunit alcohol dehydrogenase family)